MNFQRGYIERVSPDIMTNLLREAMSITNDVKFQYLEVKLECCKSLLPLNHKSSNQHGTHQALLLEMEWDYTGGLALATLISHELYLLFMKLLLKRE